MTIKEAIEICKMSNLLGWELAEYAQHLIYNNMAYAYNNSYDMPVKAFGKGKGYCWQQSKALHKILKALGFNCYLVYATKNAIPEKQFEGVKVKAHTSGHVWCRVNILVPSDVYPPLPISYYPLPASFIVTHALILSFQLLFFKYGDYICRFSAGSVLY